MRLAAQTGSFAPTKLTSQKALQTIVAPESNNHYTVAAGRPRERWAELAIIAAPALGAFLQRQRWYAAKDSGMPHVTVASVSSFPCQKISAAVALWRVTPPAQPAMLLFVPLALVPADSAPHSNIIVTLRADGSDYALIDAFGVDAFVHAWVEFQLEGSTLTADSSELQAGRAENFSCERFGRHEAWSVRRSTIEQSNTSLRLGDHAILKAFRRVEQGINPELEVGRFLAKAGFQAAPGLLGWIELATEQSESAATLSVLHEFIQNSGDGWSWVLEHLKRASAPDEALLEWVRVLARRTAELHGAFAASTSEIHFRPEPVIEADLQKWNADAHTLLVRACASLEALRRDSKRTDWARADRLLTKRAKLEARLDELERVPVGWMKTRHHGDLHLGQVLVVGNDAVLVDFEGEPLRLLEQRRAKHSVLRDVAGALRSIAYVSAAAMRGLAADLNTSERQAAMDLWQKKAVREFIDAYFTAAEGLLSLPADRADADRLLRFFLLEKALYEIVYEAHHRPDWIDIPLQGALELLEQETLGKPSRHDGPFGAQLLPDGATRFRLWAPSQLNVSLLLEDRPEAIQMTPMEDGWHELVTRLAPAGSLYRYRLADGTAVPDPASRFQPKDVHGPSEVIQPNNYLWTDQDWRGRPWEEAVVYELHIGAFTPQGTFKAAQQRLDHLMELGVTAVQIMPIADFPGGRNWGYDGVSLYAPDASYGRPEDLKAFVDAAHGRGLMVFLDVVYNHFGPEGAYIHVVAPETFTERHKTPWGAAINTDGRQAGPVREFFIHNALYWLEEFHFDGLRLDAVHAILDDGPKHLLEELAERARAASSGRHVHLILENEENSALRLIRGPEGQPRWYSAQWNDDVHHVLHVAATGEAHGYYADYLNDTAKLARALAEGFAFQGEVMPYRGSPRGEPSTALPPTAFVTFTQNHDQIGNRARGERLNQIAPVEAVRAVVAVSVLLPQIPMLFMGEEWAAGQPFPFFCDFEPTLAAAVREGRRLEFARFPEFQDPAMRERIPDPTALETFLSAKLDWDAVSREPHAGWLRWYRQLLALRRRELVPLIGRIQNGGSSQVIAQNAVWVKWSAGNCEWVLEVNLSDRAVSGFDSTVGRVIWIEGDVRPDGQFGPYTLRCSLSES